MHFHRQFNHSALSRRRRPANQTPMQHTHVYEVRPRKDHRGVDLISSPAAQDRARIVFDCRMADDPAMMPLMMIISACPFALTPELTIAIATAALAIVTFILAGVTTWMAWETRSTAATATKALALEQMPILGVRDLRIRARSPQMFPPTLPSIRVGIVLFNAGRVPVKFKVKRIAVTLANQQFSIDEFASSGGRVLPGAWTTFWHPALLTQPPLTLDPPISEFPATCDVDFDFEYSDESGGQLQFITEKMSYTVSPSQPLGSFDVDRLHVD
jgi:hypothetical protein